MPQAQSLIASPCIETAYPETLRDPVNSADVRDIVFQYFDTGGTGGKNENGSLIRLHVQACFRPFASPLNSIHFADFAGHWVPSFQITHGPKINPEFAPFPFRVHHKIDIFLADSLVCVKQISFVTHNIRRKDLSDQFRYPPFIGFIGRNKKGSASAFIPLCRRYQDGFLRTDAEDVFDDRPDFGVLPPAFGGRAGEPAKRNYNSSTGVEISHFLKR